MANYIKLEWWDTCNVGNIYYEVGFKNKIFLDTDIGKPSYDILEEGEENGNGVFIKDYVRFQKIPQIQCYVPEYLADALSLLPLHSNIRVTFTNGIYAGLVRNANVTVEWDNENNDCMATVTITFQQDDQVVKTNCCEE
jgi:hypothetical protein